MQIAANQTAAVHEAAAVFLSHISSHISFPENFKCCFPGRARRRVPTQGSYILTVMQNKINLHHILLSQKRANGFPGNRFCLFLRITKYPG